MMKKGDIRERILNLTDDMDTLDAEIQQCGVRNIFLAKKKVDEYILLKTQKEAFEEVLGE